MRLSHVLGAVVISQQMPDFFVHFSSAKTHREIGLASTEALGITGLVLMVGENSGNARSSADRSQAML